MASEISHNDPEQDRKITIRVRSRIDPEVLRKSVGHMEDSLNDDLLNKSREIHDALIPPVRVKSRIDPEVLRRSVGHMEDSLNDDLLNKSRQIHDALMPPEGFSTRIYDPMTTLLSLYPDRALTQHTESAIDTIKKTAELNYPDPNQRREFYLDLVKAIGAVKPKPNDEENTDWLDIQKLLMKSLGDEAAKITRSLIRQHGSQRTRKNIQFRKDLDDFQRTLSPQSHLRKGKNKRINKS